MSMVNVSRLKKIKFICLAIVAVLFCLVSLLALPVGTTSAKVTSEQDFEEFYQDYMQMIATFDNEEMVVSLMNEDPDTDEKPNYQTRLIVTSDRNLDGFGAIASCHYKNYYYFQYENYEQTDSAYEYFSGLEDVEVMYDYETTVNGDTIEIDSSSYYSWGWNAQNDYLGANSYLTTLIETVGDANLKSQVVAVLDTGINVSHTMFKDRILTKYAKNFTPSSDNSLLTDPTDYEDGNGHGTHVSGTIAEITPSSVMILPLRVLNSSGKGYVSYITTAIEYAIDSKAAIEAEGYEFRIMNMSIGISSSSTGQQSSVSAAATVPTKQDLSGWVNRAYDQGIISVVSAGNTETGGQLISSTPANVANAIVVSALTRTYVSSGPLMYDYSYSDYGPTVDFAAPGTAIKSAWIGSSVATSTISGTSMAAPHVSACVALIYLNPRFSDYTFEKLNVLLQENADRSLIYSNKYALASSAVRNNYYGYGIINIKNVGLAVEGEVLFSVENRFSDSAISVQLSCTTPVSTGQTVEIYYTTDETADSVNSSTGTLYVSGTSIQVTKSTKILATAFVKSNGLIVKRSEISSRIYYIGNQDLDSRFTISAGVITDYTGTELTTLVVPTKIAEQTIVGVNSRAFADTNVEVLNLPNTVAKLYDYAFDSNTKLREIYCDSSSVQVGNYAFQRCTSLSKVEIPNITSLGMLAFAYSSIEEISLPKVTSIDKNVFSASQLKTIMIGKNITSIGTHTQMALQTVYGYAGTAAETFAESYSAEFYDLTLKITKDLVSRKIVKAGTTAILDFEFSGYEVSATVSAVGCSKSENLTKNGMSSLLQISLSDLSTGSYTIKVVLQDGYGDAVSSNTLTLIVVSASTKSYVLSYNQAEYYLYVNGELVSEDVELFVGQSYDVSYEAYAGYNINSVSLNEEQKNVSNFTIESVDQNYSLSVNTIEQGWLTINFISENGDILVDGEKLTIDYCSVERNNDLTFSVVSELGWVVKRVTVDGEILLANDDGSYTISSVTANKTVRVVYEEAYYLIEITFVNSCGSYTVSNGGNLTNVAHGSSREITISTFNGYKIDFISVDGEIIKVNDGSFVIENIDSDKKVIVSFRAEKTSIFARNNSTILYYFIVFLALFVIFGVANLVIHFVRKNNKID